MWNGLCLISTDWNAKRGEMLLLIFLPKIPTPIGAFYRAWPVVHTINGKDRNNDTIAPHSAPSSLAAVGIGHDER